MATEITKLTERLCEISKKQYSNPYNEIHFPLEMEQDQWFFSPELISLYGTEEFELLSEVEKKRLSFFECINFFSLNINGEKALVQGLAKRLYSKHQGPYTAYIHHFLDEENKHMIYFGNYCQNYAGKYYQDKKLVLPSELGAREEDFLFFAKVVIFEEISDFYNIKMSKDVRIEPIAREINLRHHVDESRHLLFGKQLVKDMFDRYREEWEGETLNSLRSYLVDYLKSTWNEYFNPEVYRDVGLKDIYALREKAIHSQNSQGNRRMATQSIVKFFSECEILKEIDFGQ